MPWPRYFDLLLHTPGALVKVSGIAERQQTPPKFLESILAELRQRGFVASSGVPTEDTGAR